MRLEAVEKLGYYPTPQTVTSLIAQWLIPPKNGTWRVLDPCCGKGEAIAQLVQAVGGETETWGVELAPARAAAAQQVLSKVYSTAWQGIRVSEKSISLLWLNPPYDYDSGGRTETEFLRSSLDALVYGGILVYIVPQKLLKQQSCARLLAAHFQDVIVLRFPEPEYEPFKQVVVLGRRRPYKTPTAEEVQAIQGLAVDPPELAGPVHPWPLPIPVAPSKARFERIDITDREKIAAAFALGWPEEMLACNRFQERASFTPLLPLKKGHVAMLMAAGLMGTMRIRAKNGGSLLVKGRVIKKVEETSYEDEKGNPVTVRRDRFVTTVGTVDTNGEIRVIDSVPDLTEFMEEYGDQVATEILKNKPLYNLDPTDREWSTVSKLGKNRRPLPGQSEAGLLEIQKHAAIAMVRSLQKHGVCLCQGEMGLGKTTIALAAIELLQAYPALVLCPPHLVEKWMREAQEVIPGIQVRELRRLGKGENGGEVNDARQFIQDWQNGLLGTRAIAVVASTSAKLGSGWDRAVAVRYTLPQKKERKPFRNALQEYKAALERLKKAREAGEDPALIERLSREAAGLRKKALEMAVPYPVCPNCGLVQEETRDGVAVSVLDFRVFSKKPMRCSHCGSPLFSFGNGQFRRWPIADYIADHGQGVFKVLVCDEVHEYKSKDSDRGLAFHRLAGAVKYRVALSGTTYGGKATSLFWLLHRLRIGNVHRDFQYDDERRWVARYGVLEVRTFGNGDEEEYGAYNAERRRKVLVQERPGVSPALLERLIETTMFLDLGDLGIVLPPYAEDLVLLDFEESQGEQYRCMDDLLKAMAKESTRYLSLWLQWSLSRPNSGFRDEEVIKVQTDDDGNVVSEEHILDLPEVANGGLLPKEQWLVSLAAAEKQAGRRTLVYVRQSGTRDIQPRLVEVLRQAGLRADVLRSSVDTRKREEWLRNRVYSLDVLVVNPALVQTGLDLVDFATVVFYEIQYSLYTLWQAMRRVWRLGQTKPVKVIFAAYLESLEEEAIRLMGQKMKTAQLLYGQEVGGAIVPDEEADFLTELARAVLEGHRLPDFTSLFGARHPVATQSPLGSPTAQSPRLVTAPPNYHSDPLLLLKHTTRRPRNQVPPGQLRLF
jgi:hypothetical protein